MQYFMAFALDNSSVSYLWQSLFNILQ